MVPKGGTQKQRMYVQKNKTTDSDCVWLHCLKPDVRRYAAHIRERRDMPTCTRESGSAPSCGDEGIERLHDVALVLAQRPLGHILAQLHLGCDQVDVALHERTRTR